MIKKKSHWWWLTIFAHPYTSTAIYPNIYLTRSFDSEPKEVQDYLLRHEKIHLEQQKKVGVLKYHLLYVFVLPLFWNPWRFEWELEAYVNAGMDEETALSYVRSWTYGWLLNRK